MNHPHRQLVLGPHWLRRLLGAGALAALSLSSSRALAQADISPPPPNVLLLVDTSGSMDYKTNSTTFPTCKYAGTTTTATTSERSRWIDLVEVLTGSIDKYDCQRLDRNSSGFKTEYALSGANPYDALYANPYHRPVSNGCVPGPGTLDITNKAAFPASAIKFHPFDNTAASCDFVQASDGILDAFATDVRFGLMTFDSEPRPAKDMSGLWSYFLASSRVGSPQGCITPQAQEVGVRNPEAPPWEGRAVGFGNPALGSTDFKSRNAMIQKVLLATRPYGATPIAGMLDDARDYLLNDATDDPIDSSFKFGPMSDPAQECRRKSVVLLSDGQPNMDLRPSCEPSGCPYGKAEDIALDLKKRGIDIYVIGFALSTVTVDGLPRSCSSFDASDFDETVATGICRKNPGDSAIQACCALNRIAAAGGHTPTSPDDADWRRARFADDRDQLRSALSQAIGGSFKSTTRTPFVSASGGGFASPASDLTFARAFRFAASFQPGKLDKPWIGELDRSRYQCIADSTGVLQPVLQPPDATKGDKFVDNVNASGPDARKIYRVIGESPVNSDASMRPNLATGVVDGVGSYAGTINTTFRTSSQFVQDVSAEAIKVNDTTCDSSTVNLTATQCKDRYLNWLVGLPNGTSFNRCPSAATGNCDLISEIYHSVPRAVAGRPSQFLVDQSYQRYVTTQVTAKRPSVLYASSNDGFLHAFKISQVDKSDSSEAMQVKTKTTNELWTFVPPGVLTGIPALYPASRQPLLDGSPAIKDVVAMASSSGTYYKFLLERTLDQSRGGLGDWRTILVQSYGAQRPGYFALDVTDPVPSTTGGPKFLWQLSTDSAGNQLFGEGGGTPLITTVYLQGKEVAVAVLPGGYAKDPGTAGSGGGCDRGNTNFSDLTVNGAPTPRLRVPCYTATAARARSVTIVRLDSGEILRTFRREESEVPGLVGKGVFTKALLDSPMTGQPVAYPADVGSVADRVFIGDQDGTLWRLNFASKTGDASEWTLDMFFDGFPAASPDFGHKWNDGQPIISAPVISVDRIGNLTVAFSTGDQEAIGALSGLSNYVWSLTEQPSADRLKLAPKVNWNLALKGNLSGDRVIGEMALFAGDLFFSTVGPDQQNDACSSGSGKVWGMHYLDANAAGAGKGGKLSTTFTTLVGSNAYIDATTLLGSDARGFLSGVSVTQQPTCESVTTAADDGYFAYGVKPSGSPPAAGKYQLVVPTGDKVSSSTKPGITPLSAGGTNGVAIDLKAPPLSLVVDSWASVVE
jgi:type IV pilus assembly protein PilY1